MTSTTPRPKARKFPPNPTPSTTPDPARGYSEADVHDAFLSLQRDGESGPPIRGRNRSPARIANDLATYRTARDHDPTLKMPYATAGAILRAHTGWQPRHIAAVNRAFHLSTGWRPDIPAFLELATSGLTSDEALAIAAAGNALAETITALRLVPAARLPRLVAAGIQTSEVPGLLAAGTLPDDDTLNLLIALRTAPRYDLGLDDEDD